MFQSARLKLTFWYLLIIMSVSVFFSFLIRQTVINEVNRMAKMERFRFERTPFGNRLIRPIFLDEEILDLVKDRITFGLILINGVILISSGWLGYVLAGKTLKPIGDMIEEQNRFISDASHEFRTPLTSLKTAMEVSLRDRDLKGAEAKALITDCLKDVGKLESLSEGLLQLTHYRHAGDKLEMGEVDLGQVIIEAVGTIRNQASAKKIKITNSIGDITVTGNVQSLTDLFVIILDNAVKYSGKGRKIEIAARKYRRTAGISVTDQGIGIPKKDISRIFDRFYRADMARTQSSKGGYGLGLSIAKKIIELHKGTVDVESEEGKGTTITVFLPIAG